MNKLISFFQCIVLKKEIILAFCFLFFAHSAQSAWNVHFEGGPAWQSQNDQAVPGDTGTRFSLVDFEKGPFAAYRLYVGHKWNERHEWRVLYAPLKLELKGTLSHATQFVNTTFLAGPSTTAVYQFNSYRFTYAYHLEAESEWKWILGFTGKIRDAEVRLTQGSLSERKTNIGFVPLFHFRTERNLTENLKFKADFDGLVAPQGRAFDLALFLEHQMERPGTFLFGGYRTVEGGADNDSVYNFAWFHYLTFGARAEFD